LPWVRGRGSGGMGWVWSGKTNPCSFRRGLWRKPPVKLKYEGEHLPQGGLPTAGEGGGGGGGGEGGGAPPGIACRADSVYTPAVPHQALANPRPDNGAVLFCSGRAGGHQGASRCAIGERDSCGPEPPALGFGPTLSPAVAHIATSRHPHSAAAPRGLRASLIRVGEGYSGRGGKGN